MPVEMDDLAPMFRQIRALCWQHHHEHMAYADRQLMLTGQQAALQLRSMRSINHVSDAEFRVFSQMGEDGIIEWLVQNLPVRSQRFIEFGVEDYNEANTRFLMRYRNWKGLVLDASAVNVQAIRDEKLYWLHDLTARCAFITRENINDLIAGSGFGGDIGLLSIDIDGNDYWVLDAIECVQADILVCEYNAVLGDRLALTVPYDPAFQRSIAHPSYLYFGASIRALEQAAERKGYTLVGSNRTGHNAFFVRKDLAGRLDIADRTALPSMFRESRSDEGELSFAGGLDRLACIKDMPVLDLSTGRQSRIGDLGELYSPEWRRRMGC